MVVEAGVDRFVLIDSKSLLSSLSTVPLHNSCSYGHLEVSELLIKAGAEVNAADLWQYTPLHEAAAKSRLEVCSLLLAHGADPTLVNCHGKSVLDCAPTRELAERLAREHRGHLFHEAIRMAGEAAGGGGSSGGGSSSTGGGGSLSKLKKMINAEVIAFRHPFTGDGCLHVAVSIGPVQGSSSATSSTQAAQQNSSSTQSTPKLRKQLLELLIRKGAPVNEKQSLGQQLTPLHMAADRGATDLMEVLLKHGAKINALDSLGQTALHRSSRIGQLAAVQTLLSYGADLSLVSLQGYTAEALAATEPVCKLIANHRLTSKGNAERRLLEASRSGEVEVVRAILGKHAHLVNCRDVDGRQSTPLHFAAGYNRLEVVQCLLERGADVHAKDKGGLGE